MAGFANDNFLKEVIYADNVDFSGAIIPTATVTTLGQLLIGTGDSPAIAVGNIVGSSSITVTPSLVAGVPTITLTVSGSGGVPVETVTTSNATPQFVKTANTENIDFGISNLILGSSPPITTGVSNIGMGINCLLSVTSGTTNVCMGSSAGRAITTGTGNVAIGNASMLPNVNSPSNVAVGDQSLRSMTGGVGSNIAIGPLSLFALTTGSSNISIGDTLVGVTTGTKNISIGQGFTSVYTSSESNNILIGNPGVVGESNITRIGSGQSKCFISGVDGVNVGSVAKVVTEASDQLGTATLTAGAGITITPTANTITITATSAGFTWSETSGAFAAVKENGYFITTTSTATLPASPAEGDTILFVVDTTNVLTIQGNTGQTLRFGTAVSASAGTAASISGQQGNSCELVYKSTGTTWISRNFVGNWTIT